MRADIEKYAVVRVADEVVGDLLGSACGVRLADVLAESGEGLLERALQRSLRDAQGAGAVREPRVRVARGEEGLQVREDRLRGGRLLDAVELREERALLRAAEPFQRLPGIGEDAHRERRRHEL